MGAAMKRFPLRTSLLALLLCQGLFAADQTTEQKPEEAPKQATEEQIKARLAEHAREKSAKDEGELKAVEPTPAPAAADAPKADEPVTLMPEIKISSSRISELDIEIKKLEKKIAKEKKKIKPTELDKALNGDDAPKALAIFGGKTASQRESVAADRVTFMEAQRDILEAMKHVRTKKEQDQLQKQLNDMKTMQRELDENLH